MPNSRPTPLAWFLLCLLGLIWGTSFLGVALSLEGFGPISVAAIRISLAALILTVFAFLRGDGLPDAGSPLGRRIWLHCLGMALFSNAVPFALLSWGQLRVTSGFAGVTMAVVPLLVLPLAHVFVPGERMTWRRSAGFLVGFVGVVFLIRPFGGGAGVEVHRLAQFACIAASGCYALGSITTRLAPSGPYLSFAAAGLLLASALIVPAALIFEGIPPVPPPQAVAGVLYLGVFPTALATLLLVFVVQTAGPSFLSLVNYMVPVWALLIGAVVLSEPVPPQFLAGLVLILAGLGVSQSGRRILA